MPSKASAGSDVGTPFITPPLPPQVVRCGERLQCVSSRPSGAKFRGSLQLLLSKVYHEDSAYACRSGNLYFMALSRFWCQPYIESANALSDTGYRL